MRNASNVDITQREIVSSLRKCGVAVQHLHTVGNGCPDLLCGWRGVNVLLECKGPNTPVTKQQQDWHSRWPGPVFVVRTFQEAMDSIMKVARETS